MYVLHPLSIHVFTSPNLSSANIEPQLSIISGFNAVTVSFDGVNSVKYSTFSNAFLYFSSNSLSRPAAATNLSSRPNSNIVSIDP